MNELNHGEMHTLCAEIKAVILTAAEAAGRAGKLVTSLQIIPTRDIRAGRQGIVIHSGWQDVDTLLWAKGVVGDYLRAKHTETKLFHQVKRGYKVWWTHFSSGHVNGKACGMEWKIEVSAERHRQYLLGCG